jgi:hypothetical protein
MSDEHNTGLVDELDEEEKKLFEGGDTPAVETPVEAPAEVAGDDPLDEASPVEEPAEEDNDGEDVVEMGEGVNKGRFIRHGAFHRQREMAKAEKVRREALEKEMSDYRAKSEAERARIDERLRVLMQAMQPQPDQEQNLGDQKVPNPEEDPFAYMRYLEGRLNALGESTQGVQQRFEHQDQYTSAKTAFMQDAGAFSQKQPDFMDAYTHLMRSRDNELKLIGRADPRERQQIIQQEEFMIVSEAIRQGRSPSELFYALANDRGYRKADPAPVEQPAPAAAPAQQKPTAVQQVKQVAAAQVTAKSLSSAAGSASPAINAETLGNMSDDEFAAIYAKMSREQRRQHFGG